MKALISLVFLFSFAQAFAKGVDCTYYSKFKDVEKGEMKNIVAAKKATIIDVNSEESFAKSNIPGSLHFASNEKNFAKVLPKDKNAMVVAYCGGKMCTAWQKAAKMACEMGYTNIRHFSEGISGWNKMAKSKKM